MPVSVNSSVIDAVSLSRGSREMWNARRHDRSSSWIPRNGIASPVGPVVQLVAELVDRLLEEQRVEQAAELSVVPRDEGRAFAAVSR